MRRIAATGHMDIAPECLSLIRRDLVEAISREGGPGQFVGISCIAEGADSLFAEVVLECGGALEVVLPSTDYRQAKVKPRNLHTFDTLMSAATAIHVMPFQAAGREAYEAANHALLADADFLIAVWDGDASKRGGTGTVVNEARSVGLPVLVIWPEGARRGGTA